MNFTSIGDGAQFLSQSRQNTLLKSRLNTLTDQLSSGEIKDKNKLLGGDTVRFSAIEHGLKRTETQIISNKETGLVLTTMQRTLDAINAQSRALSETLVKLSPDSQKLQIDDAARNAVSRFSTIVNSFNTQVGGRSLFAGTDVNQPALAPASDILADLVTVTGGATDDVSILAAVDFWFDDPTGGFATMGYLGDAGAQATRRLDEATLIALDVRADDPDLKTTLKAAAIAALADQIPGLSQQGKAELLFEGGIRLQTAAANAVSVQARLGFYENEVERVTTTLSAEQSALSIARNNTVNADPFETVSALQQVQLQLETHYQMTARLSRLSLAEYLR